MTILQKIIEEQFIIHKEIEVQDVYKLLYQGTFGPEHMIDKKSQELLYEEFEKAEPNKEEDMMERISPTFFIYRVNIRPYKFYEGNKEALFSWFYESSKIKEGSNKDLLTFWKVFTEINKEKNYLPPKEIKEFEEQHLNQNPLPGMHHSEQYRKANNPSYRVVNYIALHNHMLKHIV